MKLDRYLLGDNPFMGINHISQERAREKQAHMTTSKVVEVIKIAVGSGAEGLLFTTHPVMYSALREMRQFNDRTNLGLYTILPYAHKYVRMTTEKGLIGLVSEFRSELSWKAKARTMLGGGLSLISFDPSRALRAYVDYELEILRSNAPGDTHLKVVFLHEVITDLAISFKAGELLREFSYHILDNYSARPGFVTRNFPRFVVFAERIGLPMDQIAILTPFNKMGFQMNPSKETCERALHFPGVENVIAMSILASGFLNLREALEYLREHPTIQSYVVGVSTPEHARETFGQMRTILS